MLLAIDVGNTQTVIGVYDGEELRHMWRIATNKNRSFTHFGEMTEVASEMKKLAKKSWGSCYLTDRRGVNPA